jgi:hypothetical protein
MSYPKLVKLIELLAVRSKEGRVRWKEAGDSGVYHTTFPEYEVRLSSSDISLEPTDNRDYHLEIYDSEGTLIEQMTDQDLDIEDSYDLMRDLYETARRSAMGVHQAIDHILASLEEDEEEEGSVGAPSH